VSLMRAIVLVVGRGAPPPAVASHLHAASCLPEDMAI